VKLRVNNLPAAERLVTCQVRSGAKVAKGGNGSELGQPYASSSMICRLCRPATSATSRRRSRLRVRELGNADKQEVGRWANNRVENSHFPFRQRERAMTRSRRLKTLQKFASVHANVHNHFNLERHLVDRQTFKERRSAALAEWQIVAS